MMVKFLLLLLIGYNAYNIHSLKVYENPATLLEPRPKNHPHLHLIDIENGDDVKWENGLTICLRFNFKRIPSYIFHIGNIKSYYSSKLSSFEGISLVSKGPKFLVEYEYDV